MIVFLVMPKTLIFFVLEVSPFIISILFLATLKDFDKNLINSLFAAPSTGGVEIFIFKAPSYSPTIWLFEARGITLTGKIMAPLFSLTLINYLSKTPATAICKKFNIKRTIIGEISNIPSGGINFRKGSSTGSVKRDRNLKTLLE